MNYPEIKLKRGKEESLKRFHPWVFSGAIDSIANDIKEGDVVRVLTCHGDFIAVGHYQQGSIAVRVLSFHDVEIDHAFWCSRLLSAYQMRNAIYLSSSENNTYRLVHGEGDYLPGLIIDVYGDTAVMQSHSIGMHLYRNAIANALQEVLGHHIANVYYKSETTLPFMTSDEMSGFVIGNSNNNIAVENGLQFYVDWYKGQKTGFFIDQRENRSLLEKYSKGKKVLNMFCYTGGFSVYAMRGGAELVHSVDSSAKAIDLTEQNITLNFPNDERHQAYCIDAFKFLEQNSERYNLIILDPPAFAKHRGSLHNALKGYTRLNLKALEEIEKGGILFTFSCSQVVSKEHFRNAVFTAAAPSPATAIDAGMIAFPASVTESPKACTFLPASSILARAVLVVAASSCRRRSSCSVSMISLCRASYLSCPRSPFSSCCLACSCAVFRESSFSFVAPMASFKARCFWESSSVLEGSSFRRRFTSFNWLCVFLIVVLTLFSAFSRPVVSPPISTVMPLMRPAMYSSSFP